MYKVIVNGQEVNPVLEKGVSTVKISAHQGDRYIITDAVGGKSPAKLITKKVKKDLQIFEEGTETPSVIIEEYYAEGVSPSLSGISESGSYLAYSVSEGGMSLGAPMASSAVAEGGMSTLAYIGGALAVGGVAIAAGGSSGGSSTPAATTTVSGSVTAGPAITGNQLSIQLYQADGVTLLATATVNANGTYSANIGTYSGVVIAKVVDGGTGADYTDEATGTAKDLNAVLMTVAITPSGATAVTININPITTIAAQKAGLNADGTGSIAVATAVTEANSAVATLFGLGDIVTTAPTTTVDTGFNSADGLSAAEKYGTVLAALSGADSNYAGDTQAVINAIVADLSITAGTPTVTDTTTSILLSGANTAAYSNPTDNSGLYTTMATTMQLGTPTTDGAVSALTPTQIAALTPTQIVGMTPAQIALLGVNIASLSPEAIATLNNDQVGAITQAQVNVFTLAQMAALSNAQIAVFISNAIWDITAPTATITMSDNALQIGETSTVTITFSEAITSFTNADVTVQNGTLSTFTTTDNITWSATFTPTTAITDTTNVITLANTYTDIAHNAGATATSANYAVDTVAPSATITMSDTALKIGETATVTITFSEAVSGFDNTDVTVQGGAISAFETTDNIVWTATFIPNTNIEDTTNVISLANTYTDSIGNTGAGASSSNYTIDMVAPTAVITMSDTALKAGETSTVTVTFSEAVADFSLLDVTPQNGTIGIFSTTDNIVWTATFTPNANITDTTNTIGLVYSYTDTAGNTGTLATSTNYTIDTTIMTATITMSDTALKIGETATVTIVFGSAMAGFSNADVTVENGTLSTFTSSDNITWTATYTPTTNISDTTNTIALTGSYADVLVNYSVDTAAPTAVITMGDSTLNAGETSTVTITFSEAVSGFDNTDVTVQNGTLSTFTTTDNITWSATFTPSAAITDTTNVITLANTYTDGALNAGTAATSANYTIDTSAPSATVTMNDTALKVGETSTVTVTFSEAVIDFSNTDVTAANGTLSTFTTSDNIVWTATFTPTTNITDTTNVIALNGIYRDASGNTGGAATSANYTIDTKAPSATITMSDTSLKAGETSTVTVTFSEAVSGFDNTDVTVENGTLSTFTTTDNITWTATFTPTTNLTDTTNVISLANTYADGAGNSGTVASSANYAVDTTLGTAAITMSDSALKVGDTSVVTVTFSIANPGFTNADVTAQNGTLDTFVTADGGLTWTATFTPSTNINVLSNTISLSGAYADITTPYTIDTIAPSATIMMSDTALKAGETSTVTITFSEAVSGFSNADVTAENGTLSTFTTTNNVVWSATFTPTTNIADTTNVITLANTYTDGALNAGAGAVSVNYDIDTDTPSAVITMSDTALKVGETSIVTITFNEAVSGFSNADVSVENGTLGTFTTTDNIVWSATFTPSTGVEDTSNLIRLSSTYTDVGGRAGTAAVSPNYTVDMSAPTATITMSDSALVAGDISTVTITFSEAVSGFDNTDVTVQNGTLSTFTSTDNITWNATFTPTTNISDTTNVITLADTYTDTTGSAGTAATGANYTVDTALPSAAITMSDSAIKIGDTSLVTITFSEAVTAFSNADVTAANGTLGTFTTTDNIVWSATFTPTTNIADTTNVIALNGIYRDVSGNVGTNASTLNYTIDTAAPTAVITMSDSAIKAGETSLVTVTFSEAVSGFSNADVTVENGTLSPFTSADGRIWSATFTPSSNITDTTNVITLANTYTDGAGNGGTVASSINYTVDTALPSATVTMSDSALKVGETSTVTITFSAPNASFNTAGVTAQNGTLDTFVTADGGLTWTATFTPTANISDTTNVISLGGDYADITTAYTIDTAAPSATVTMSDTSLKAGETSTVTITFSEAVSGFDNTDVTVENGTLGTFTTSDNITWIATFTPSVNITDTTNVITLANTYTDGALNTGTAATSANYDIDTTIPSATVSMSDTTLRAGQTSLVTVSFNAPYGGFTNANVTVENGTLTTFTSTDGGLTYTATFTPTAGITDTTNLITLVGLYSDVSVAYSIDKDAPVISSGTTGTLIENSPLSTVVYDAQATDNGGAVDAGVIYTLSGVDADKFNISADGKITFAATPNYEAKSTYSVTLIASDAALNSVTQALTLSVTNDTSDNPILPASFPSLGMSMTQSGTPTQVMLEAIAKTNGTDTNPQITAVGSAGEYVVTFQGADSAGDDSIFVQKFNANGTVAGTMVQLEGSVTTKNDWYPQIVAVGTSGEYVVTFQGLDAGGVNNDIFVQKFNADGTVAGSKVKLEPFGNTTGNATNPQITAMGTSGEYIVTFSGTDSAGDFSIFVQKFNADGTVAGAMVQLEAIGVANGADKYPQITSVGTSGEYVVTFYGTDSEGDNSIFVQKFNADGTVAGAMVQLEAIGVTNGAEDTTYITSVGMSGEYVVTFIGKDSEGDNSVFVQKFNSDGTVAGAMVQLEALNNPNGTEQSPSIKALGTGGEYVVAFQGYDSEGDSSAFVQKFNSDGTPSGAMVRLEATGVTNGADGSPQITAVGSAGEYVVSYYGADSEGDVSTYIQKFNANGAVIGSPVRIEPLGVGNGADYNAQITAVGTSGEFVVTWRGTDSQGDFSVFVQRFGADGLPIDVSDYSVATTPIMGSYDSVESYTVFYSEGVLRANGLTYASGSTIAQADWQSVTLEGVRASTYDLQVIANMIDATSAPISVSALSTGLSDRESAYGTMVISGDGHTIGGSATPYALVEIYNGATRVASTYADGSGSYTIRDLYVANQSTLSLRVGGTTLQSTYLSAPELMLHGSMTQLDSPSAIGYDRQPQITAVGSAGEYVVAWQGYNSSDNYRVYVQKFNADGTPSGTPSEMTGLYPLMIKSVGSGGEYVVCTEATDLGGDRSIFVQKFNADGTAAGLTVQLEAIAKIDGADNAPQITSVGTSGEYVVTFQGADSAGDNSIFVQKFNADGTVAGAMVQLEALGVTNSSDIAPQITAVGTSGEYVVTFQGADSAGDNSIFVQKFNSDGTVAGAMVQLEAIAKTNGADNAPQITSVGTSGEYVVTFQGADSAGDYSIFVQKFNSDGTIAGAMVQLEALGVTNSTDESPQITAVGTSGEYVVTFRGVDSAGDNSIFVQKFNSDGTVAGAIVQLEPINQLNSSDNYVHAVSVGTDGAFVVTWEGINTGGKSSIFVQRFDAYGNPVMGVSQGGGIAINATLNTGMYDVISYSVTYTQGSLIANGVTYASGATIALADWVNVSLEGADPLTYELRVTANLIDGFGNLRTVSDVIAGGSLNTVVGTDTNNTLSGSVSSGDLLYGEYGDDTLDGLGGSDKLYGDEGNDILLYDVLDSRIDGGAGVDTVRVAGGGAIDLSSAFAHIEKIDLSTDTGANTLSIRASDVIGAADTNVFNDTTFGTTALGASVNKHQLLINAGENDIVKIDASGWSTTADVTLNGHTYAIYNNANVEAQLLIEKLATIQSVL